MIQTSNGPISCPQTSLQRNALFLQKQLPKLSSMQNLTGKEGNDDHACKEILLIFIDKMNRFKSNDRKETDMLSVMLCLR